MNKHSIEGRKPLNNFQHCLKIMRITLSFLFFCILFSSASNSYSQKFTIKSKTASIKEVCKEIEKGSDYVFIFSDNCEKLIDKQVNVEANSKDVTEVLNAVLSSTGLTYKILDKQIVVYKSTESAPSVAVEQPDINIIQQPAKKQITGKVVDAQGDAIIGANIIEQGTTNGTVTDVNGNFSLDVENNATIRVSYIGYLEQSIATAGQSVFNITLQEDTQALDEVVVVGYGTQRKVSITGSIASVKTEELQNIPASNLSNTLAGRASGVQIIGNSGLAGASSTIRIRGSFAEPLYVIDGIIKDKAAFDALDANEVENVNFLKDAASAAVYGSSAGNGVVLITTKAGTLQKPRFEYKTSFSTSRTTQTMQGFTATEELEFLNNVAVTLGQEKPYGPDLFEYFKDKSYDINDLIWQNPSIQQHNLSVNGGSDRIKYYLALGYHDENGSYHNTDFKRYNFRSNVSTNITDRFKINFNLSGNQRNYNRWYWPYDGAEDFIVSDWYRATFNWTRLYPFYVDEQGNPTNDPNDIPVKTTGGYHPPEIMLNGGYRNTQYRDLTGIIRFDLDLGEYIDGLSTSVQGHLSAADRNMKSFVVHNKWYIFQPASATNRFIPGPVDFSQVGIHNLSAGYENIQEDVNLRSSYQLNWFLNYDKRFDDHSISALVVYEQATSNGKNINGRAEQLLSRSIDQIYNASGDTQRRWFNGSESEFARASWIGRLNYNYADKYIAEFSFRYDGNYKFAPDKRWGFFPSFSAAWRLSEENFMKDIDWLSNLKLRGSYGTTGSDSGIGAWRWTNVYQKSSGFVFGNSLHDGLVPGAMPNPDITWSTITMWDVGLEYGLLNNRLRGEFSLWSKVESDILGTRSGSTPTTLGASLPAVNYAQRSWDGVEVNLTWNDRVGEVNYEVYGNLGYAIDQWDLIDEPEAYTDGTYKDNWRSALNKPANRVGGYISKGIIRTQAELDALPEGFTQFGRVPKLGTLLFEDIRGQNYSEGPDGKIDENDWTYLSDNGIPRINFGFGINSEWKNIVVNAHFQGVGAYDRMVRTRNGEGVFQQPDRPYFSIWAKDYWTPENPDAKYPRVSGAWMEPEYGGGPSSFWLRNGSYLRLKNLNIGYTLPSKWYNALGLQKVQVFVNGTNLFVLSGFKEYDPEQETLDSYPLMKTFTGGLSINF
ncbi:TonB-linked outer membrane protein, SusC/RagA family [Porphyromonadaceae bacterium KHP3R9]|nr:TonB-linked outer membrane protein, SusC/RagA family [Porphyromonadaceae bacterium KHP3R9]